MCLAFCNFKGSHHELFNTTFSTLKAEINKVDYILYYLKHQKEI